MQFEFELCIPVTSMQCGLSSPSSKHFPGDSQAFFTPESIGDAGLKSLAEVGDLTDIVGAFVIVTAIASNSLKFEARGVGWSEYASDDAYPDS